VTSFDRGLTPGVLLGLVPLKGDRSLDT
jgi:hypothetical protein